MSVPSFNSAFVILQATNTPQSLIVNATLGAGTPALTSTTAFFKLWIYPGTAAISGGAGGLVLNVDPIWVGKVSAVQADPLAPTQTLASGQSVSGLPLVYETQVNIVTGEPFPFYLSNVYITGNIGDGVWICWT